MAATHHVRRVTGDSVLVTVLDELAEAGHEVVHLQAVADTVSGHPRWVVVWRPAQQSPVSLGRAAGGIVTRPATHLAGESGPEAMQPPPSRRPKGR